MKGLNETLANLASIKARFQKMPAFPQAEGRSASKLREVANFGSNPGNLRMRTHLPADLPASAPLVVALHGCTQTADVYDHGSGWSALADALGFAVVFPEQQRVNNPNNCFNWFQPDDIRRDSGEALSIAQMIDQMINHHGLDRRRVFIVGLSAGGAMTASMLAAYPEVFNGGAILAGLPHGTAGSVAEALRAMPHAPDRQPRVWGDLVRGASSHRGRWPKVSLWHGSSDAVVEPGNMEQAIRQWVDVHGLNGEPDEIVIGGHQRRIWRDDKGEDLIEAVVVDGMNHGVAIATTGANAFGNAGPFHYDVGISSSFHIARFWGVAGEIVVPAVAAKGRAASPPPRPVRRPEQASAHHRNARSQGTTGGGTGAFDPRKIMEKTLRSAGLLPRK